MREKIIPVIAFLALWLVQPIPAAGDAPSAQADAGREAASAIPETSIWADLLARHVRDGLVDYAGFKRDEPALDRYLAALEAADPEAMSERDAFAYYINVYNAWTIKLVLTAWPNLKSIRDLGGFWSGPWKIPLVRLKTGTVDLDHVEHRILRPRFKDPRVHFAINCASLGCPPLLNEPYVGDRLDEQLDRATKAVINDPSRTSFEGDSLWVIAVFDWFREDFQEGTVSFVLRYAEGDLKRRLASREGLITVRFLDWDWRLNDAERTRRGSGS